MIKVIFSIRDELIGYGDPFALPSEAVAIREFKKATLAEAPNDINTNKADKVLFRLATFDDQSGEIVACKEQLLRANEVER